MHARTPGGLADRFGVVPLLSAIEQEAAIPPEGREMFVLLGHQIDEIDARIKTLISTLRRAQGQRGQPASRLHSGRRTDHCINAGCRDQPGDVRIRPPSRRLGRPDNKGTFDRRQTTNGRHQPGRQRTVARVAGTRCRKTNRTVRLPRPCGQLSNSISPSSRRSNRHEALGVIKQLDGPYGMGRDDRVARAGGCWSSMEVCVDAGMRG
jgi:hypothetical protein